MLQLVAVALLLSAPPKAELVEVRKIWDRGAHNAFTDLVRFKDAWFCVFREGKKPRLPRRRDSRPHFDRRQGVGIRRP